jgi:hypothetical protein
MKLEFPRQIFEEYSNTEFHESSSGERVVPCGRTDVAKLIVAFLDFVNAPTTRLETQSAFDKTFIPS